MDHKKRRAINRDRPARYLREEIVQRDLGINQVTVLILPETVSGDHGRLDRLFCLCRAEKRVDLIAQIPVIVLINRVFLC